MNLVGAGGRIVDIGAGVNPLVPYLTAQGYEVDTVDPSEQTRTWPPKPDWTGWGFLDYAAIDMAHHSWNCRLDELPAELEFDAAYSISVIEHLPAADRRQLLSGIAQRVRRGGVAILTVDLVRNKNDLWNRRQGQVVEPAGQHGTFQDLVKEAKQVGLVASDIQTVRGWGDVPVDIGLVVLHRGSSSTKAARMPLDLAAKRSQLTGVARKAARRLRSRLRTGSTA
jgi:SAM-dependent methyltransferase